MDKVVDGGSELRTQYVFEALRSDLLESRILPGERLKFVELAKRFNISQTVVREALTRLSEQGLVENSPKRGFAVTPLSAADLRDLTNVRIRLESMALRDSIEKGDLAWESGVVAAHHALERTPFVTEAPQTASTWRQLHRAFHQALCAGSGSPRLEKVVAQLRDSSELYRFWYKTAGGDAMPRDVRNEHRELMDAVLRRDGEEAARILSEHMRQTTENLLNCVAAKATE